jgi:ribosomal protein S18 acetylase RimI-like enzyme
MLYHALYVPEGDEPFPRSIVTTPEIARYVADWGQPTDLGFAAVDDAEHPIGAVWIRLFSSENQGYGYVDNNCPELSIAVLPNYRNHGLGTGLLERMIAEAGRSYSAVSLSVSLDNPAKRLYERLGFEIIERHGTSLTMIKTLVSSQ